MKTGFESRVEEHGEVTFPAFSSTRVMMMPFEMGNIHSIPDSLDHYKPMLQSIFEREPLRYWFRMYYKDMRVGYLTIDEKVVKAGQTHRRAGLHVDGVYKSQGGGWGGGGGSWGGNRGFLVAANRYGCRAWKQSFEGYPKDEGECDHLAPQLGQPISLSANVLYFLNPLCVHESMPMVEDTPRQFFRLSFPSDSPWFEGYTENPLGIKPTGPILPRRSFMDAE